MRCFIVALATLCWLVPSSVALADITQLQQPGYWSVQDSIRQAQLAQKKRLADSIRRVQDSLTMQFIGLPDPERPNQLADSLRKLVVVQKGDFLRWLHFAQSLEQPMDDEKGGREQWVMAAIGLLLLLLGLVRVSFPNEVLSIIQAFYNDRMLLQINKEDTLYSSWPFIFLYVLFGFAMGLFIYVCNLYYGKGSYQSGVDTFLGISIFVMLLFVLKIIVTRFLGVVFDVRRIVREYVSILYLSYFNAALVFLPVVLILSLVPETQMVWIIPAALTLVLGLFVFRFVKTATNVLTNHQFSKFYLFMYLCCLEIAPVLILVKVLGN
ncbi:DUF4271 domain-containing protein [Parapedobacter indicus]|uniref:DUF4271 domain-containing protein n=1 Tax=Parapedobacter indicus TaxID=1477437 RepID=A0A1I3Q2D6_9SPHI|nr:DUF4271 domain-containing protein [Parapedobacter indicus]PPL00642.1 uncharacterized protein DUF4271 [Parapedobacter indicus]SFJ27611.1 protein of unknown function [Parapedobacter indicus]